MQGLPFVLCERLVLEGSLQECNGGDKGRVCDGAVTKELANSKQVRRVEVVLMIYMMICCGRFAQGEG